MAETVALIAAVVAAVPITGGVLAWIFGPRMEKVIERIVQKYVNGKVDSILTELADVKGTVETIEEKLDAHVAATDRRLAVGSERFETLEEEAKAARLERIEMAKAIAALEARLSA